ncbi:VanZ family protein [Ornithinibacillus sp. BX22]|uniref:VanZ family protein n=3 Tax=Bacillaceae TaxID=186817 RepID=A0A923L7N5_9BACI|nr:MULTISPECIES: VanZ family protein [Ornithinibacillus]MBC5637914.1 VanZ family protein [Ornithinibacillus hominis]MBS3681722.1 VanZ family protein [Ornithinibacillus massiliensis]
MMNRKLFYWFLPIIWMAVIFFSSATPYEKQDMKPLLASIIDFSILEPYFSWVSFIYNQSEVSIAALGVEGFIEFFIRKGAHFGAFFLLMILFCIAFRKTVQWNLHKILVVSFGLTIAYAIMDELHQGLTPNRTPFYGDVVIDGFGASVAYFFLLIRYKKWKKI